MNRILQVVGAMNMGGVETFLMNIMRNSSTGKSQFIFLCYLDGKYDYEEEIASLGGVIVRIADTRVSNPIKFVRSIEEVIRRESIDIVHSHVDLSTGYVMAAAKRAGVHKRIAHAHNTSASYSGNILRRPWFYILKNMMNKYATHRVACGELAGEFMFPGRDFNIIRNGIDTDRFKFSTVYRSEVRSELGIGTNDKVIVHVGRFEEAKNHTFLIEIFKNYEKLNQDAHLLLIGAGSRLEEIKSLVNNSKLSSKVHFLGKLSDVERYYSAADSFVMPSLYEGSPVSLIEAQASGLYCLVSDNIDKSIRYGNLSFFPLEKSAEDWAGMIKPADVAHRQEVDKKLLIENSVKGSVSKLEEMYEK